MTRKAVEDRMRLVAESVFELWWERFRPSRVFGVGFVPAPAEGIARFFLGGRLREGFGRLRAGYERGMKATVDYAEEVAFGTGSFGKYENEILATDGWYAGYDGNDGLGDALVERYETLGEAVAPLVASNEDGFWDAARDAYTKEEAVKTAEIIFGYADTVEPYAGEVNLEFTVLSRSFGYADEALRSLRETEDELLERMTAKADEVYSSPR